MQTSIITPAALRISKIGLGCVTFGREIDEAAAQVLLDHALSRGVTLFDTAAAYATGASESISVVQNNHNLAVSDIGTGFRAFCAAENVAVVTYSPLGAGFLTGKHQRGVQPGSRFDIVPGHQDVYFNDPACRRLAHLESVAARSGCPQAHLALAWALHQPGIVSVLVGGRTPAHLDQAFAALAFDDATLLLEAGPEH